MPSAAASSRLLAPATALLRRMSYRQKFALIAVVLLAPGGVTLRAYWQEIGAQIAFSAKERVGVQALGPAGRLDDEVARAQLLALEAAAGDRAAAAGLPRQQAAVRRQLAAVDVPVRRVADALGLGRVWPAARRQTLLALGARGTEAQVAARYDAATAALAALITQIGDGSNLILDPDLDAFYVMDAIVTKLPAASRAATGAVSADIAPIELERRIAIARAQAELDAATAALSAGLATSFRETDDAALRPALAAPLRTLGADAAALSRELDPTAARLRTAPAAAERTGEAVARLRAASAPALDALLAARIDGFTSRRRTILVVTAVCLLLAAYLFVALSSGMLRAVRTLSRGLDELAARDTATLRDALDGMAQLDLTVEVTPQSPELQYGARDELGAVAGAINRIREDTRASVGAYNVTREKLAATVGDVAGEIGHVADASTSLAAIGEQTSAAVEQIASAAGEVARGAERQAVSSATARQAAESMASATGASAERMQATAEVADQARSMTADGEHALRAVSQEITGMRQAATVVAESMDGLLGRSEQITGIVETITQLAEQTGLLSLNAAIEAARAGEQGRGFAVVADEVGTLAAASREAASSIAGILQQMRDETQRVAGQVTSAVEGADRSAERAAAAEQTFAALDAAIAEMAGQVADIAQRIAALALEAERVDGAVGEIAAVSEEAAATSQEVASGATQTSGSAQQTSQAAVALAGTAQALSGLVGRFRLER